MGAGALAGVKRRPADPEGRRLPRRPRPERRVVRPSAVSRELPTIDKVVGFIMPPKDADAPNTKTGAPIRFQQDAPSCSDCGSIMVRNGACYKCLNCGSTSGCS